MHEGLDTHSQTNTQGKLSLEFVVLELYSVSKGKKSDCCDCIVQDSKLASGIVSASK